MQKAVFKSMQRSIPQPLHTKYLSLCSTKNPCILNRSQFSKALPHWGYSPFFRWETVCRMEALKEDGRGRLKATQCHLCHLSMSLPELVSTRCTPWFCEDWHREHSPFIWGFLWMSLQPDENFLGQYPVVMQKLISHSVLYCVCLRTLRSLGISYLYLD